MWSGFYNECEYNIFYQVLVFHTLSVLLAFGFYVIRNLELAKKLVKTEELAKGLTKERAGYLTALIAAYVLSITPLIVAIVVFSIHGSIDIWALSENT
jgi:hypothetical protein